ncbi:MarR family winged helix-turn-helix transcriptional regulator [Sphingobacterium chuzhouense]|nr:MarR family transcriptional regulator [Sphingobacterium chuzhouense]
MVNKYRSLLEELELTYPQYLVMLVLWEKDEQSVSAIGEKLNLDSGTLTPLLKRLEQKEIVMRKRSQADERMVVISLTAAGHQLKTKAQNVPSAMVDAMSIPVAELKVLKNSIDKILSNL